MPVYIKVNHNYTMFEKIIKKLKFGSCKITEDENADQEFKKAKLGKSEK